MSILNPSTVHREFFGVPGSLAITLGLPTVITLFALITNEYYSVQGLSLDFNAIIAQIPSNTKEWIELCFDFNCWAAYLTWFTVLVLLDFILPGKKLKGIALRDKSQLEYRINGKLMAGLLIVLLLSRLFVSNNYYLPELQFIYDNQLKLTLVTTIFSFLLAVFVYVCSFIPLTTPNKAGTKERILSINGNSGNIIYDWFIGRELNPRIGSWDIKLFCELRPGMLLWFLINLSCMHNQYHKFNKITDSLLLVNFLQAFYVFDGVLNEEGVLSMMDITTDGFGFMLSFGDLAWLPWSYSLQARYLALPENSLELGYIKVALILALSFTGYYIFHSSNKQKSDFRMGKLDHLNLKSIKTKTGSKLLCDGWWGISQHTNYFGDWLIGWSWCLPTGFQTLLTYFYVIYFGVLLVHRQTRDEAKCRLKYGKQWEEYEEIVPYKIVPYVY
ncbi:unnamed protein product [Debaryomyces tyrocola]|nr:unnamed protein product [Debaryomyces tyrocola]